MPNDPLSRDVARRRGEEVPTLSLASDPRDLIVKRCYEAIDKLPLVESPVEEISNLIAKAGEPLSHLRGDIGKIWTTVVRLEGSLEQLIVKLKKAPPS